MGHISPDMATPVRITMFQHQEVFNKHIKLVEEVCILLVIVGFIRERCYGPFKGYMCGCRYHFYVFFIPVRMRWCMV